MGRPGRILIASSFRFIGTFPELASRLQAANCPSIRSCFRSPRTKLLCFLAQFALWTFPNTELSVKALTLFMHLPLILKREPDGCYRQAEAATDSKSAMDLVHDLLVSHPDDYVVFAKHDFIPGDRASSLASRDSRRE
jgi:hypothetical protein